MPEFLNLVGTSQDVTFRVDQSRFLLKAAFDVPTGTKFIPYFGFGLGLAIVSFSDSSTSSGTDLCAEAVPDSLISCPPTYTIGGGSTTVPAAQLTAGLSYILSPRLSIFSQINYDYTAGGTAGDYEFVGFGSYSGTFGLRTRI